MAFIELVIDKPENGQAFTGIPNVTFQGKLKGELPKELNGVSLYYRWYSSLNASDKDRYSMNQHALTAADLPYEHRALGMGSHVITFAVCDQPGEKEEDFKAIRHGGVTGGKQGDSGYVIHVFKANILDLINDAVVLRTDLKLKAEAPWRWGDYQPPDYKGPDYNDYHDYNRLKYRWELTPVGDPPNRPTLEFKPTREEMVFDSGEFEQKTGGFTKLPSVSYTPPPSAWPAGATGKYEVALYVEDKATPDPARPDPARQDKKTIQITLIE